MRTISFFLLFYFTVINCSAALDISFNPLNAGCGSQIVTATFDCNFSGLIYLSWPDNVDISEIGDNTDGYISVVNGVFQFVLNVDDFTPESFSFDFDILTSDNSSCADPVNDDFSTTYTHDCVFPDNNLCIEAITLPVFIGDCNTISFSTAGATATPSSVDCGNGNDYYDLWYKFTATNEIVNLKVDSGPGELLDACIYSSCGQSVIYDFTIDSIPDNFLINSLEVGNEYILVLKKMPSAFGDQKICLWTTVALPVSLAYFNAKFIPKDMKVNLHWMTFSEVNFDKFIIQRKEGENGEWKDLKEISGISQTGSKYEYEDHDINVIGLYYYRLKLLDLSGNEELSEERVVSDMLSSRFRIYPTYSDGNVTLLIPKDQIQQSWKLIITSVDGIVIKTISNSELTLGRAIFNMDLSEFENGTYLVNMLSPNMNRTERLIIQK